MITTKLPEMSSKTSKKASAVNADKLKYLNLITTAAVVPDFEDIREYPDWFYIYDSNIEMSGLAGPSHGIESTALQDYDAGPRLGLLHRIE